MKYEIGNPETKALRPKNAVGHIVGNFLVKNLLGDGVVDAKCLLCGNDKYSARFYKIKSGHTKSCGCLQAIRDPEQYIGKRIHKLTIRAISPDKTNHALQVVCKCECGTTKTIILNVLLRGKIQSCGCLGKTRGGLTSKESHKYYDIWRQMMARCYQSGGFVTNKPTLKFLNKPKPHARYKDYGARGLTVAKEWHDLDTFIKWYKENIKDGESMDRTDNDVGYSPSNCRTASIGAQNRNQRVRKDNSSGYKGVYTASNHWRWSVKHEGVVLQKEGYDTPERAMIERNNAILINKLPHDLQLPGGCLLVKVVDNQAGVSMWYGCVGEVINTEVVDNKYRETLTVGANELNAMVSGDKRTSCRTLYKGITKVKSGYRYYIKHNGKVYVKEGFESAELAILERNICAVKNGLPRTIVPGYAFTLQLVNTNVGVYRLQLRRVGVDDKVVLSSTSWATSKDQVPLTVMDNMLDTYKCRYAV